MLERLSMGVFAKPRLSKTPFGRQLLAIRASSESEVADCHRIEEPTRIVLLSASAGAAVAFGSYGALLIDELFCEETSLPPQGDAPPDPVVRFAYSLHSQSSMEAAYRVATWALIGELGDFFWRPNYATQMQECATAFGLRNDHEVMTAALGEPVGATTDGQLERRKTLEKGALIFMVAAALDAPAAWDDPVIDGNTPRWHHHFREGLSVATMRMRQLAPNGLPRWVAEPDPLETSESPRSGRAPRHSRSTAPRISTGSRAGR